MQLSYIYIVRPPKPTTNEKQAHRLSGNPPTNIIIINYCYIDYIKDSYITIDDDDDMR